MIVHILICAYLSYTAIAVNLITLFSSKEIIHLFYVTEFYHIINTFIKILISSKGIHSVAINLEYGT